LFLTALGSAGPARGESPPVNEVTIAGTRLARTPGSAHVVTERQLERYEYDDAQAIARQVPGVYVRQEDGVGLRPNIGIRGANPDRSKKLTLMEDGILFGPAPYSAPAAYYFPLMTRMTAMRVVKGPSAIQYGPHTVGGAIDFVSRPVPDRPTAYADLAFGDYGYGKVHAYVGGNDGQLGFLIEGVRLWNSGFKELPSGADTGSTRDDFLVKTAYVVDPRSATRNELQLKLAYADEVSDESYLGLTDADFRANPYQRYAASALDQMKNHRTSVVFTHRFQQKNVKLRTDVYRHDYSRIWRKFNRLEGADPASVLRNPNDPRNHELLTVLKGGDATANPDTGTGAGLIWVGPNNRNFISEGVQSVLSASFEHAPVSQRLELGFRLHHDQIDRRHSENAFVMTSGELVPANRAELVNTSQLVKSDALALYAVDAFTLGELTVTPGARIEVIRSTIDDRLKNSQSSGLVRAFMPGIGVYYGLLRGLGVLAGVYRGFSPPAPGSADGTKPEYSVNYEAGARYSDGPARAEVIGFVNDYSNMTDVCSFASGCTGANLDQQFDAGAAHIYGIESYVAHELPLVGKLTLPFNAAYTFTRGVFQNTFVSDDPSYGSVKKGDEISYIPRHQFNASVGVEHPEGGGSVALNYVAPMREEAGSAPLSQSLATDEQFWLDVVGRVHVWGPISLYGTVRNVLGGEFIVSRRPFGARPNPPRWVQVGAKIEL
jgi:Fe(3+) dicitrate transport protein